VGAWAPNPFGWRPGHVKLVATRGTMAWPPRQVTVLPTCDGTPGATQNAATEDAVSANVVQPTRKKARAADAGRSSAGRAERRSTVKTGSAIITGKNFDSPDETRRPFEKGRIDVINIGGLTFYRETLQPGWQWSKHVKPVVGGESCQRFHVKIFLAGRQRIRMDDGTEMEFGPGDVAIMHPGHDAWVVGHEPNVLIELADVVKREG